MRAGGFCRCSAPIYAEYTAQQWLLFGRGGPWLERDGGRGMIGVVWSIMPGVARSLRENLNKESELECSRSM
jgi:hypothetical protein